MPLMNKTALMLGIAMLVLAVSGIGFATDYYDDEYWEDDYDASYYYDSGCCCGSALILSILGFVAIRQ